MPLPLKRILLAGPDDAAFAISAKASSQSSLGWMVSTVENGSGALALLDDHVSHCVVAAVREGTGEQKVKELTAAIGRYLG